MSGILESRLLSAPQISLCVYYKSLAIAQSSGTSVIESGNIFFSLPSDRKKL